MHVFLFIYLIFLLEDEIVPVNPGKLFPPCSTYYIGVLIYLVRTRGRVIAFLSLTRPHGRGPEPLYPPPFPLSHRLSPTFPPPILQQVCLPVTDCHDHLPCLGTTEITW